MFANVYEKRKFNGLLPICREIRRASPPCARCRRSQNLRLLGLHCAVLAKFEFVRTPREEINNLT